MSRSIGSKIKSKKGALIILVIFWALVLFISNPFKLGKDTVTSSEIGKGEVLNALDPITSETTIDQPFVAGNANMCSVGIYFDTLGEQKYGKVIFTILSESGETVAEEKIDMSLLEDKSFYTVSFDKIPQSKGRMYFVRITSTVNKASGGVSVWYRAKDTESMSAVINGDRLDGTIRMKVGYFDYAVLAVKMISWLLVIIVSFIFLMLISKSYEKNFLLLSFSLGILILFINPFPHVIDESTHFFRSFMISQGDFYDDIHIGLIGGNVPTEFSGTVDSKLSIRSFCQNPEKWLISFGNEKDFYTHPYMSSAIPVNHCFAAAGIFLCRLLRLPALFVILSGRLVTYLIYVALCYFAIKKARYYKGMFFMIASLPLGMWLAASYSIDPLVISGTLLFTSICLRHFFDKDLEVTGKEIAALFITAVMIASVKYLVYTPVLLMVLLIPKEKLGRKRTLILVAGLLLLTGLLLWQIYMMQRFPFVEDRNGDVNVSRQIDYMMCHIPDTIRTFLLYMTSNLLSTIEGFNNYKRLKFITPLIGLLTVFGSVLEPDRYSYPEKGQKKKLVTLCLIIFVLCSLLIMASLYVGFTPVGGDQIEGIQTRYFLPLLIFAMLPISMIRIKSSVNGYREKVTFLMGFGIMDMLAALLENVF